MVDSGEGRLTSVTISADEVTAHNMTRLSQEWVDTWLRDIRLQPVESVECPVVVQGGD